jgi:hypothetical protein
MSLLDEYLWLEDCYAARIRLEHRLRVAASRGSKGRRVPYSHARPLLYA